MFFFRSELTEMSEQPIRTHHLSHVTGYQPISDQYFLIFGLFLMQRLGLVRVISEENFIEKKPEAFENRALAADFENEAETEGDGGGVKFETQVSQLVYQNVVCFAKRHPGGCLRHPTGQGKNKMNMIDYVFPPPARYSLQALYKRACSICQGLQSPSTVSPIFKRPMIVKIISKTSSGLCLDPACGGYAPTPRTPPGPRLGGGGGSVFTFDPLTSLLFWHGALVPHPPSPIIIHIRNRPNQEILVPDWLITSHVSHGRFLIHIKSLNLFTSNPLTLAT
eukprot:sb/3467944/